MANAFESSIVSSATCPPGFESVPGGGCKPTSTSNYLAGKGCPPGYVYNVFTQQCEAKTSYSSGGSGSTSPISQPSGYPHWIILTGTGSYSIRVTGQIKDMGSGSFNGYDVTKGGSDSASGSEASGKATGGYDGFFFSGGIDRFTVETSGGTVIVNGQKHNAGTFAQQIKTASQNQSGGAGSQNQSGGAGSQPSAVSAGGGISPAEIVGGGAVLALLAAKYFGFI